MDMTTDNAQSILWNIPYQRNPFFTGRDEVLTQLHRGLQADATLALSHPQGISGLGGIGKTQTALEYAYCYGTNYNAVFWIRADSITSLTTSMIELAGLLELPERYEQDQNIIVQAVLRWLRLHPGWLLIYDNIDDLSIAEPFLPKAGSGHILLTTRAHALGGIAQRLDIQKMEPEIGALLLLRRAGLLALQAALDTANPDNQSIARSISEELDGLPLALDQAGAYIKEAPCLLSDYLTRYQNRRGDILRERGSFDQEYPAAVATTWSLSFEKLQQASPAATELLTFCAFLAPDSIPEKLLTGGAAYVGDVLYPVASDALQLDFACKEVLRFSLFHREADRRTITMHRLVQAILQENLLDDGRILWQQRAINAVSGTFPSVEYENWSDCQQLLPHAQVCAKWVKQLPLPPLQSVPLLLRAGYYLHEHAQDNEAASLLEQSLKVAKNLYGSNHQLVADSLNNLALVYQTQGKQRDAEDLLLQALSVDAQAQGKPSGRARSLNNLANLYQEQSRYRDAETLFLQALELDVQQYGSDHVEVATDLNNLALLYRIQGRYQEAEPLARRAQAIKEKEHGHNHPAIAKNVNNLAALYYEQGLYEKAEPLYKRALAIREQVYEEGHPEIANSLNNLALLYEKQGEMTQAEVYFRRALTMKIAVYGEKHQTVANTQNNLAQLLQKQKKHREAENLFRQVLETREQILTPDHVTVARTLNNLAMLYEEQERYDEAEALLKRACKIFEKVHGPDHITIAHTYNNLAIIYQAQQRYTEAEAAYHAALPIYECLSDSGDPTIAEIFSSLGEIYLEQEKYQQAETCYRQALTLFEQVYEPRHPVIAQSLNRLAATCYLQGNLVAAEPLYLCALKNFEEILGPEHIGVAQCLENLAALYADQARYGEAQPLYQRALLIYQQHLEPAHPQIQTAYEAYQRCQRAN
jgi:tetratricopeptide (TPR) repeat protein